MDLLGKFNQALKKDHLIRKGDHVLVALSGGPDSVALLCLLIQVRAAYKLKISAAHINHKLRKHHSDQDQRFVEELCEARVVPLEVREAPIDGSASGNVEEEARIRRYDLLTDIAEQQSSIVVTAHTMDDQAETFLMKLFRGSGTSGLSGIYAERIHRSTMGNTRRIVRPLLFAQKQEILDYLQEVNQAFRLDKSNENLDFDRNWIRHQLIPMLEKRLNPRLVPALSRTAFLMNEIEELLQLQAAHFCEQKSKQEGDDFLIELPPLKEEYLALRKQVVRHLIKLKLGDLSGITMDHTRAVLGLLERRSGKEVHLPRGLRVIREFDQLRFSSEAPVENFEYLLDIPGELSIPEVRKKIRIDREARGKTDSARLFLPERRVTIRNRRPGDHFRLLPDEKPTSLKELFIEKRIPITEREKRLIVETDEGIKWVEGLLTETSSNTEKPRRDCYHVVVLSETF